MFVTHTMNSAGFLSRRNTSKEPAVVRVGNLFTYDRFGNRFQSGAGNAGVPYTTVLSSDIDAATNRFISTGATPITYDAAGNILQDKKFRLDLQADGMNYTYDANGFQITAAGTEEIGTQNSIYDAAGQPVEIESSYG